MCGDLDCTWDVLVRRCLMYSLYRAAGKNYRKLDGLIQQIYFPAVLEARRLKSGCWQDVLPL